MSDIRVIEEEIASLGDSVVVVVLRGRVDWKDRFKVWQRVKEAIGNESLNAFETRNQTLGEPLEEWDAEEAGLNGLASDYSDPFKARNPEPEPKDPFKEMNEARDQEPPAEGQS